MNKVIIMRGLPGSGKSTWVKEIKEYREKEGYVVEICSADDFRYINGVYKHENTREPLDKCYEKFKQAIDKKINIVIVDNTNTTLRSMSHYARYAYKNNYEIEILSLQPIDINILYKRNTHNVPMESFERMLRQWVPNPTVEEILVWPSDWD